MHRDAAVFAACSFSCILLRHSFAGVGLATLFYCNCSDQKGLFEGVVSLGGWGC